jgi:hypothetical protein
MHVFVGIPTGVLVVDRERSAIDPVTRDVPFADGSPGFAIRDDVLQALRDNKISFHPPRRHWGEYLSKAPAGNPKEAADHLANYAQHLFLAKNDRWAAASVLRQAMTLDPGDLSIADFHGYVAASDDTPLKQLEANLKAQLETSDAPELRERLETIRWRLAIIAPDSDAPESLDATEAKSERENDPEREASSTT